MEVDCRFYAKCSARAVMFRCLGGKRTAGVQVLKGWRDVIPLKEK